MALQDGFKVLGLRIVASGSGYLNSVDGDTGTLRMIAPGSSSIGVGDGFTGEYEVDGDGKVTQVSVTAAGKNYSSGSWDVSGLSSMYSMFEYAISFNQDLGAWDVSGVENTYRFSFSTPNWTLPKPKFR